MLLRELATLQFLDVLREFIVRGDDLRDLLLEAKRVLLHIFQVDRNLQILGNLAQQRQRASWIGRRTDVMRKSRP